MSQVISQSENIIPIIQPNTIERNIIIGSLLGDGSLALYGRSKNAYYREHGCEKQQPYRQWKQRKLARLGFKITPKGKLASPSHTIYTQLFDLFYINKTKTLTKENLKLLNHPIGLACLFMDDGSLVIDHYTRTHKIQIFPRIALYTLCFSYEENLLLVDHIKNTFDIEFKLKKRSDGKNYILEINRRNEIYKFIELIKQYVLEIPEMHYKIDIEKAMEEKYIKLKNGENENRKILTSPLQVKSNTYTDEEVQLLLQLKKEGYSIPEIAYKLNRSYWGTVDKYRRLKSE